MFPKQKHTKQVPRWLQLPRASATRNSIWLSLEQRFHCLLSCHTTVNYRLWRAVSMVDLRAALNASSLCMPDQWTARSVDDLTLLHDTVFTELADRFAPLRQVTRRPRPSDPWFDADCRAAKRLTRRLEHTAAKAERHGDNAEATDRQHRFCPVVDG